MTYTQKYTIVSFIDAVENGYEFTAGAWPAHITLAATFSILSPVNKVIKQLNEVAERTDRCTTHITGEAYFGPKQTVHVALLDKTTSIYALHTDIVTVLHDAGVAFNEPHYILDGYKPHITLTSAIKKFRHKQTIELSSIALIDMYPNHNHHNRTVLWQAPLHNN
jgi:2'-5' RNA ligase